MKERRKFLSGPRSVPRGRKKLPVKDLAEKKFPCLQHREFLRKAL